MIPELRLSIDGVHSEDANSVKSGVRVLLAGKLSANNEVLSNLYEQMSAKKTLPFFALIQLQLL